MAQSGLTSGAIAPHTGYMQYLGMDETARRLGISRKRVRTLVRKGALAGVPYAINASGKVGVIVHEHSAELYRLRELGSETENPKNSQKG